MVVLLAALGASAPSVAPVCLAAPTAQNASITKFEDGRKAFEAGRFEEALVAFQASLDLQASPNTRLYLARCYRALGRTASAYVQFKLASREAQERITSMGEKRYAATRDAAASESAEIEPKVPRVTLAVPSDVPADFVLKVDGTPLAKAAWGTAIETDPGPHEVEASAHRTAPFREKFNLASGEQKRISVVAKHLPTATVALVFNARPSGMAVDVDGKPVSSAELDKKIDLDVGEHTVTARAPGYATATWTRTLKDGDSVDVPLTLQADSGGPSVFGGKAGTPKWMFFSAAGASVLCLGLGVVFAIQSTSIESAQTDRDPLLRDPERRDDAKGAATRADIFFGGGLLIGVGAGVLYTMTDWKGQNAQSPQKANAPRVTPWLGAGAGGITAQGRF